MSPRDRSNNRFSNPSSDDYKRNNSSSSSSRVRKSKPIKGVRRFKPKNEEKFSESFSRDLSEDKYKREQKQKGKRNSENFKIIKGNNANRFNRLTSDKNDSSFRYKKDSEDKKYNSPYKSTSHSFPQSNQERMILLEAESNDIFWGRHTTQEILESGRPIHRVWCTSELKSSQRFFVLLKDAKSKGVLVEEVSWARLGQITSGAVHQGIALQAAASETLDLMTLINACSSIEESPLLLALDGITDPHNLGAIVRSAEAMGAHGIVLPQRRSAGLTGSVAKVAAGALEHLPVARVVNLNRSLDELKKNGYRVIGLANEGGNTLNKIDTEGPLVVVVGSEGKGLSLLTRKNCDQLVRIPLRGITSSLNASVATSIFLYEVARKGWMKGISGNDPSPKLIRAKFKYNSST